MGPICGNHLLAVTGMRHGWTRGSYRRAQVGRRLLGFIKGKHVVQHTGRRKYYSHPALITHRWEKPSVGWMKLNVDGFFEERDGGGGGIGAILRDSSGIVIFAACGKLDRCGGALEAELLTYREGIAGSASSAIVTIMARPCR